MMSWLSFAWIAFSAATVAALSTTLRFLFPNVLFEPKMAFKIGKPDEYDLGKVDTRWEDRYGVWIIRSPEGIYALSTVCTHLGCKPSWLENEQKFKCPCHGSGFYKSGINFEGPAPRPLERFAISLADDGQILVDKSLKFQYEKGEWTKPLALLPV
ncbi:MAG: ubiquinol-cytochrome c reductase iron-sulfur subunit [Candidatus Omnitrophica bacterium]|nr:ubiquinol-cytochrome c reductase iron-sulfur subunit [Candidatus Omnitrophota bacterium]